MSGTLFAEKPTGPIHNPNINLAVYKNKKILSLLQFMYYLSEGIHVLISVHKVLVNCIHHFEVYELVYHI